jgi:hypothetical protein
MASKVLLLHGPILSTGVNFYTAELKEKPVGHFSCAENIRALSAVFRSRGYRIAYSAWLEDAEWIEENNHLFDCVIVGDQGVLTSKTEFYGKIIQNNKVKLYYGIYQGLLAVEKLFGSECSMIRLRSDVSVDPKLIEEELDKLSYYSESIFIEYADQENHLFVPDFICISKLGTQKILYKNLLDLCFKNGSYHISSHIDHGCEFVNLIYAGHLQNVICMAEEVHKTMVWRGIPRYFVENDLREKRNFLFNCLISYPACYNLEFLKNLNTAQSLVSKTLMDNSVGWGSEDRISLLNNSDSHT